MTFVVTGCLGLGFLSLGLGFHTHKLRGLSQVTGGVFPVLWYHKVSKGSPNRAAQTGARKSVLMETGNEIQ